MTHERETLGTATLTTPRARIGVIMPSSNRMIEPQFHYYAPPELGVHFTRAQITGRWSKSLVELGPEIVRAAQALADSKPDLLVFNCTATSMKEGPDGDAYLLGLIRDATGIETISTAAAVSQALTALGVRKLALVTPYVQATNDHEIEYFHALGFEVVRDAALGLKNGDDYITISPERWTEITLAHDDANSHGFFMSCTNTTQIESIDAVEQASGKPVVSANQAVLWAALSRLETLVGPGWRSRLPGRLTKVAPAQ